MAVQDRIRTLRDKHATLDQAIDRESARALPDTSKLAHWKREKLWIKDTIVALGRGEAGLSERGRSAQAG